MNVCIYGMGRYGISTYYKLLERGIGVQCFGDACIDKQGYFIKNIKCISFEDVMQLDKRTTVIIVAIKKNNRQLIDMFRKSGFRYVSSYDKLKGKNIDEQKILTNINEIIEEKRYIENIILKGVIDKNIRVSNDIMEMAEALRKRGKYEST